MHCPCPSVSLGATYLGWAAGKQDLGRSAVINKPGLTDLLVMAMSIRQGLSLNQPQADPLPYGKAIVCSFFLIGTPMGLDQICVQPVPAPTR